MYYVSGCPQNDTVANPLEASSVNVSAVFEYLEVVYAATIVVANQSDAIAAECNEDPASLQTSLVTLQSMLCGTAESVYNLTAYFSCQNFNGLYATVAYDAVCYNGNGGLAWVASTQFVVLVCAMVLLTLRSGFRESVDESQLRVVQMRRGCFRCCGANTPTPGARDGTGAEVGPRDHPLSDDDAEEEGAKEAPGAVWKGSDDGGESLYIPDTDDDGDPPKGLL